MTNVDLGSLARRLDRIEQALARLSVLDDLINSTDPPPEDLGRIRSDLYRLLALIRRPPIGDPAASDLARLIRRPPIGDPAASDLARLGRSVLEERLSEILSRNPGWFTDPPPDDFLNVRVLDLIRRWRGGFSDPAPEDLANARLRDLLQRIPGGGITDPGPDDLARLTKPEIEAQLHKVNAELVRLKSLERMLNERRSQLGGSGKEAT
jgi:hypothetical protein